QAEDGIRDATVTGVQTCALPIWVHRPGAQRRWTPSKPSAPNSLCLAFLWRAVLDLVLRNGFALLFSLNLSTHSAHARQGSTLPRSEERRVGKGRRSRGSAEQSID